LAERRSLSLPNGAVAALVGVAVECVAAVVAVECVASAGAVECVAAETSVVVASVVVAAASAAARAPEADSLEGVSAEEHPGFVVVSAARLAWHPEAMSIVGM